MNRASPPYTRPRSREGIHAANHKRGTIADTYSSEGNSRDVIVYITILQRHRRVNGWRWWWFAVQTTIPHTRCFVPRTSLAIRERVRIARGLELVVLYRVRYTPTRSGRLGPMHASTLRAQRRGSDRRAVSSPMRGRRLSAALDLASPAPPSKGRGRPVGP